MFIEWSATAFEPSHNTIKVVIFINKVETGPIKIIVFIAFIPACFKLLFALRNLPVSWPSRTKDFTTRTLVTLSCTVEFKASILVCIRENRWNPKRMSPKMETIIRGTVMASTKERSGFKITAIIIPPIIIPGERRAIRRSIFTKFCS